MKRSALFLLAALLVAASAALAAAPLPEGTGRVDFHGYTDCVRLENDVCRVVLCHQTGGRVLEYSWKGTNVIYLDPKQAGRTYDPRTGKVWDPDGGRMDIGPEMVIPKHPMLWLGPWTVTITGPRSAELLSVRDKPTGVRLKRRFVLDEKGTGLHVTQTILNVSNKLVHWCHWSRTFAPGGGIVYIPLSPFSRFPHRYIMYGPGNVMNYQPTDPNISVAADHLLIKGPPAEAKLGFDSAAGALAYHMKNGLVFTKRFPVHPGRAYNEMAGLTISVWYYKEQMCELEPIGPATHLAYGKSESFTEDWWITTLGRRADPTKIEARHFKAALDKLRTHE